MGSVILTFFFLGLLDFIGTALLARFLATHLTQLSVFSKVVASIKFGMEIIGLFYVSGLQFRNQYIFWAWDIIDITPALLYLASRTVVGASLTGMEYAFVVLSCLSNLSQMITRVFWKWFLAPKTFAAWQDTFSPDWEPGKESAWLRFLHWYATRDRT